MHARFGCSFYLTLNFSWDIIGQKEERNDSYLAEEDEVG